MSNLSNLCTAQDPKARGSDVDLKKYLRYWTPPYSLVIYLVAECESCYLSIVICHMSAQRWCIIEGQYPVVLFCLMVEVMVVKGSHHLLLAMAIQKESTDPGSCLWLSVRGNRS